MKGRGLIAIWMPLVVVGVAFTGLVQGEQTKPEAAKSQASQAEAHHEKVAEASRPKGLSDAQISAWLILQHHREVEISKWGAERAASDQVQAFAQDMAAQHGRMITKLHAAGLVDEKSAEAELGQVLQELANRVEKRLSDGEGRIDLGFRGNEDRREAVDDRRDQRGDHRDQLRDKREDVRDTRQNVREARRDDNEKDEEVAERGDAREKRRDLRDERSDLRKARRESAADERRENVRAFVREAMPFVRENLPTILELVGESVETAAQRDTRSGWIDFQRQVARKHIKSVQDSLQEQSGSDFDEAFLAYQVGAHMQMVNTLEVAQNYVSSDVRPAVDQMLNTVQDHLTRAQQLMQKLEDPGTSSSQQ